MYSDGSWDYFLGVCGETESCSWKAVKFECVVFSLCLPFRQSEFHMKTFLQVSFLFFLAGKSIDVNPIIPTFD